MFLFCPTQNPTAFPTPLPTINPTAYPTIMPSMHPTAQPTFAPTQAPTKPWDGVPGTCINCSALTSEVLICSCYNASGVLQPPSPCYSSCCGERMVNNTDGSLSCAGNGTCENVVTGGGPCTPTGEWMRVTTRIQPLSMLTDGLHFHMYMYANIYSLS